MHHSDATLDDERSVRGIVLAGGSLAILGLSALAGWDGGLVRLVWGAAIPPVVAGARSAGPAAAFLVVGLVAAAAGPALHFARAARRERGTAAAVRRELSTAIAERMRIADKLRETDDRLQLVVNSVEPGIVDCDLRRGTLAFSPCVAQHLGLLAESESRAAIPFDDLHAADRERIERLIQTSLGAATGDHFATEYPVIRIADHQQRCLWLRGRVFVDHDGHPARILVMTMDITERKRTEETLREANELLREAGQRKDEFLATLAHELRNPLAPIRFALRLLDSSEADASTARRSQEVIGRQVTQLVRLIDDLLDVSRLTCDKVQLRRERIELSALMRSVAEMAEPHVTAAGHRLAIAVDSDAVIEGDAVRLVQVFANLLNNAVKFTPPGGRIQFEAHTEGTQVVVGVADSGIGIDRQALPHIFDMFHQADRSLERSNSGLGIGLALAKRLVELHGGTIEALSEGPNRGAEFRVRLPLATAARPAARPPAHAEFAPASLGVLTVLIVDDNHDSAEMLQLIVGMRGHRTHVAHDGLSALEMFSAVSPEVVLLDIGLPGMNGYGVAGEIRRRAGDEIHLVAITGWGQADDRRRARESGFNCHMTKPADPQLVLAYLDAVARGTRCEACGGCAAPRLTRASDIPRHATGHDAERLAAHLAYPSLDCTRRHGSADAPAPAGEAAGPAATP